MSARTVAMLTWLWATQAGCYLSHEPRIATDGGDAGHDAGRDAGIDAARDAGADAGNDAGADSGNDAGVDAGAFDAGPPPCEPHGERIFSHTGGLQTFRVPDCVAAIAVKLWGGGGGSSGVESGGGAFVQHPALAVSVGETLEIIVAGGGEAQAGFSMGGFGGGGNVTNPTSYAWSGAGGGRSAIRRDGRDVITAGGGGGTGYPALLMRGNIPNGPAGAGCAGAGGSGGDSNSFGGGGGGTLVAGGRGGTVESHGDLVTPGIDGALGIGGYGLDASRGWWTSGGGGGGYFGGGSGAHETHYSSGGGGGGSCLVPAGGTYEAARGATPGGMRDRDYVAPVARGATTMGAGGAGRIVLRW